MRKFHNYFYRDFQGKYYSEFPVVLATANGLTQYGEDRPLSPQDLEDLSHEPYNFKPKWEPTEIDKKKMLGEILPTLSKPKEEV